MQTIAQKLKQALIRLIAVLPIFIMLPVQAGQQAGEVTAVFGEAQIISSESGDRAATQGMVLQVGDILQTGTGGHIHLRMVDDALVSLRPNSKIKFTTYTYQPGVAAITQIRLDLLYGTVRSVTGKGGDLAKDRFRMNTPIAAIGVRGTDFIVRADAETTLVNVQSGAIILAPLGEGCLASALGPCQTTVARMLSAEMRDTMLKFIRGTYEPKLLPLGEGLQILPAPNQQPQAQSSAPVPGKVQVDSTKQTQEEQSAQFLAELPDRLPAPLPASLPAPLPAQLPDNSPIVQTQPPTPAHYQMVWGHWSELTSGDDLGRAFLEAAAKREVTVGNEATGLFRDNTSTAALPLTGQTEFTLRQAQVTLATGGIQGKVLEGSLGVNFDTKIFRTQLTIQHPALTDTVNLKAAGTVYANGIFYSLSALSNATVAGSLSRDGAEAGYQFKMPTAAGNLTGTTLWIK